MKLTWLIEGRLAASGMIYPDDADALLNHEIGAVLSLTVGSPFPSGPPDGIQHLHVPVPDFTAPPAEDLDRGVEFLRHSINADKRVIVHCGAGLGRTGTMLAAFLVAEGESPETAIRLVREARPGSIETRDQERCIFQYARREQNDD